jgi:hypothetical protein
VVLGLSPERQYGYKSRGGGLESQSDRWELGFEHLLNMVPCIETSVSVSFGDWKFGSCRGNQMSSGWGLGRGGMGRQLCRLWWSVGSKDGALTHHQCTPS